MRSPKAVNRPKHSCYLRNRIQNRGKALAAHRRSVSIWLASTPNTEPKKVIAVIHSVQIKEKKPKAPKAKKEKKVAEKTSKIEEKIDVKNVGSSAAEKKIQAAAKKEQLKKEKEEREALKREEELRKAEELKKQKQEEEEKKKVEKQRRREEEEAKAQAAKEKKQKEVEVKAENEKKKAEEQQKKKAKNEEKKRADAEEKAKKDEAENQRKEAERQQQEEKKRVAAEKRAKKEEEEKARKASELEKEEEMKRVAYQEQTRKEEEEKARKAAEMEKEEEEKKRVAEEQAAIELKEKEGIEKKEREQQALDDAQRHKEISDRQFDEEKAAAERKAIEEEEESKRISELQAEAELKELEEKQQHEQAVEIQQTNEAKQEGGEHQAFIENGKPAQNEVAKAIKIKENAECEEEEKLNNGAMDAIHTHEQTINHSVQEKKNESKKNKNKKNKKKNANSISEEEHVIQKKINYDEVSKQSTSNGTTKDVNQELAVDVNDSTTLNEAPHTKCSIDSGVDVTDFHTGKKSKKNKKGQQLISDASLSSTKSSSNESISELPENGVSPKTPTSTPVNESFIEQVTAIPLNKEQSPTKFAQQVAEFVTQAQQVIVSQKATSQPLKHIKIEPIVPLVLPPKIERNNRRERVYKLLPRDIEYCSYMMETYGEDYESMTKDKRNIYMDSASSMRRKIRIFRDSPQYELYLKAKEEGRPIESIC